MGSEMCIRDSTGANSLHIFATSAAGGPLDVVMLAGLNEGVYVGSWMMYVTDGNSAYYNVQEDQAHQVLVGRLRQPSPFRVTCKS